jgi:hypothetical protein
MPYHLDDLLESWNLNLSDKEFQNLWQRFDVYNIGGIRIEAFLRFIDYNPIDHYHKQMHKFQSQSNYLETLHRPKKYRLNSSVGVSLPYKNEKSFLLNPIARQNTMISTFQSDLKENQNENKPDVINDDNVIDDNNDKKKNSAPIVDSTELKLKRMIKIFKKTNRLSSDGDIVGFLNNKVIRSNLSKIFFKNFNGF